MSSAPPPVLPALRPTRVPTRRFATLRTVMALVLREMSTRYGRTPGGYIWGILEPLGAIIVLSIGFGLLLRAPPLGTTFLLFYATGYLPFNLYQSVSLMVARAIGFSRPLLLYPAVTWVDAVLARFLLNSLTGILVTIILLAGILTVTDNRTVLDIPPVLMAMALAMLLGLGIGVLNCAVIGLFPVWDVIWSMITRPLFIASGILFLYDNLPQLAREILWYNPLVHITGLMRQGFYPMYKPLYINEIYVALTALVPLVLGLILLGRYHRDILNR